MKSVIISIEGDESLKSLWLVSYRQPIDSLVLKKKTVCAFFYFTSKKRIRQTGNLPSSETFLLLFYVLFFGINFVYVSSE